MGKALGVLRQRGRGDVAGRGCLLLRTPVIRGVLFPTDFQRG